MVAEDTLSALKEIVRAAGRAILEVYGADFRQWAKPDASPVTEADLAAHRVIVAGLEKLTPDVPVLSEESAPPPFATRRQWQRYWLVDPLDGTREFINRNGEFTVNIALVAQGRPVLGLVGVPADGRLYLGDVAAGRAWLEQDGEVRKLTGRRMETGARLVVAASRSHGNERLEAWLQRLAEFYPDLARRAVGSSLKFCLLAAGVADIYPRLGPTSEWDIAAAEAVLTAAGGGVRQLNGAPLEYNKASFLNPEFIAVSDRDHQWPEAIWDSGAEPEVGLS